MWHIAVILALLNVHQSIQYIDVLVVAQEKQANIDHVSKGSGG